jgi:hypothetical protein
MRTGLTVVVVLCAACGDGGLHARTDAGRGVGGAEGGMGGEGVPWRPGSGNGAGGGVGVGGAASGGEGGFGGDDLPVVTPQTQALALVTFGCTEDAAEFHAPGWNTLLREPEHTRWVADANPAHCGVADVEGTPPLRSFIGIRGSAPLTFDVGRQLVASVFHRSGHNGQRLRMRVSFTDADAPADAGDSTPWYTMYVEDTAGSPRVGEVGRIVYTLTTPDTVACETAPPTVGAHTLVNLAFDYPDSVPGQWVLTRVELTDAVDDAPPLRPKNLVARTIAISPEAGKSAVELTWDMPPDPPGRTGGRTGISRHFIYRDGVLYDLVSRDWTRHHGEHQRWVDLGVKPGETHHYGVTALDGAIAGLYPTLERIEAGHRASNESEPAEIDVPVPARDGCGVIGPAELEYLGAFAAPRRDDWAYSGQALTFYPGGNPSPSGGEGPGSLYAVAHDRDMLIGELSIPEPVKARTSEGLREARVLREAADPWPRAYDGRWQPRGDVQTRVGLAYHPGVDGVGEGLHYSIFMSYSGDQDAASHGMLAVDLKSAAGPWHLGGVPGSDAHVPFLFTGKFVTQIPQAWADAHTQGRSLMVGLGWPISGHGYPSAGPAFGAIAPWERGRLPERFEVVSHVPFLRYGTTGDIGHWFEGWTQSHFYLDAEWLEAGGAQAVVVSATRPRGDEWYGGENGYDNFYCDADIPPHIGSASLRGPVDTDNVPVLYFYNPADFARVRSGDWAASQPQPFAMLDLDAVLYDENARFPSLRALAFDRERGRLYAWENGATRFGQAAVHVWQVSAPSGCP